MKVLGAGRGLRRPGADDEAVRGARRRRRRDADRQGRGLRLRLLEAGRDVRATDRRRRCCTRTATSSSPACASCRPTIRSIDPAARRVETDAGAFEGDVLVVALGADLHPAATPGLVEAGHEFYTVAGRLRRSRRAGRLRRRPGDRRRHVDAVQVPAGAERDGAADARLPHRAGAPRAIGDRPGHAAAGADPAVARRVEGAARGVRRARHRVAPRATLVRELDPAAKVARFADGSEMPFDLFLGVPVHRVPDGRRRVGHVRRRLDPGRPGRRSRPRSRASTPSATSPASARRRPACSPKARRRSSPTRSSPAPAAGRARRRTTDGASATWSSATSRSPSSTSRS